MQIAKGDDQNIKPLDNNFRQRKRFFKYNESPFREEKKNIRNENYLQYLEQIQMLQEDLNGKLIERAEAIGLGEEIEVLLEDYQTKHNFEYNFALQSQEIDLKMKASMQILENLKNELQTCLIRLPCTQLDLNIRKIKQDIIAEQQNVKQYHLNKENLQYVLDNYIVQSVKSIFYEYVQNQSEVFNNLKKSCGQAVYDKIIQENQQQLQSLIASQCQSLIQVIANLQQKFKNTQSQISRNIDFVDNTLTPEIYKVQTMLQQVQKEESQIKPSPQVDLLRHKVQSLEQEKIELENQIAEMSIKLNDVEHKKENEAPRQVHPRVAAIATLVHSQKSTPLKINQGRKKSIVKFI